METFNQRLRLSVTLEASTRKAGEPMRLSSTQMRKIRKSLIFIADGTPIVGLEGENVPLVIPSPNVCVELGYALSAKRREQILLVQMERPNLSGQFPFDLPNYQQLSFKTPNDLQSSLSAVMETILQRFNLLT